jgi:hypothetical protein
MSIVFFIIFTKISAQISHNVPAVYDVLAARIRAYEARPRVDKMWRGFGGRIFVRHHDFCSSIGNKDETVL